MEPEEQQQFPPNSFEAQIQRLDGVILNSTALPNISVNEVIQGYSSSGIIFTTTSTSTSTEPYYIYPYPAVEVSRKKNIFDLLTLKKDENRDSRTDDVGDNVISHGSEAQDQPKKIQEHE